MEECKEQLIEIKGMCESAIQTSTMAFLDDSIHKEGLVATLNDIIELIKEAK